MQIQIPTDEESVVKSLAINAGFTSIDQYVLDLIERDKERAAIVSGTCRYYNADIHRACFALPNFVRSAL